MMVDGQSRAADAQNVPAMHDDIGLHAPVVAAEDNATEIANAFEDRYEPVSLLYDEVIPPPKVKSILVKVDRKLFDAPPENSSVKTVPTVVALPRSRPVLISDLPKVFLFIPKAPQSRSYFNLNLLDIDPNCYIPDYFDDFLTLAWLAFLIPDQTKEPTPTRKEIEDMDEDDVMEIAPA